MRTLAWLLPALILIGCDRPASQPATIDASGSTNQSKPHDPNDFSSLRTFPLKDLLRSSVKVDGREIPVWVMDTPEKRKEGYQCLRPEDAPDGHGMIFLFPSDQPGDITHGFWMDQCLLELDIAFISAKKTVLNVQRGKILDKTSLPASGPYRYVLELKAGEAAKFGVKPGAHIDIPSHLQTTQ